MEWGHEEAPKESSRGGPRQVERFSPKRGKETGQPRQWPQGRPGQKPQEKDCRATQRSTSAPGQTPDNGVSAALASIRARFGQCAIGLGYSGIRYSARELP
ncbi:MAG: hypothetical protein JO166_08050 [Deltaproteobacteria bacterium]|nr:hypothetical protein [Deltaproteobacteria bacterium]